MIFEIQKQQLAYYYNSKVLYHLRFYKNMHFHSGKRIAICTFVPLFKKLISAVT